jgi:membrane-associated phospholipid phosphatase
MRSVLWASLVLGTSVIPAAVRAQARVNEPIKTVTALDSTHNFGLKQLAVGAAGLVVISLIDPVIARDLHTGTSAAALQFDRQLDRFGDATGTIPIIGGLALTGLITKNHALTRTALRVTESVVLADLVVQASKYLVGRSRPYADPNLDGYDFHVYGATSPAFPSGHAANAFALATSLSDAAGRKWVTVGLFALATGTAWARLSEQQHWLSDVVAGAFVGIGSARFVSGKVSIFGVRAPHFMVGPNTVALRWTF